jgi:hypothetical protein
VVDEVDEGHSNMTSFVKIEYVCAMRLQSQEPVNRMGEEMGEEHHVQSRARAWISWCYSLERRCVRHGTDEDVGRNRTERPSILPAR